MHTLAAPLYCYASSERTYLAGLGIRPIQRSGYRISGFIGIRFIPSLDGPMSIKT